MTRTVVWLALPILVCTMLASAVLKSREWNAPLSTQNELRKLANRGMHAEAAALGHRYFASTEVTEWRLEECMLLTTIANEERLADTRTEALQTREIIREGLLS